MPKFKSIPLTLSLIVGMHLATINSAANAHAVVVPLPQARLLQLPTH